ncbi:MAG TPA: hypothetical protein VL418_08165 [Devosiaceae bacterium]|nr:hypothetical protein [Devosiaceae bacterium]
MKSSYIFAGTLVALFALPGTASQLMTRGSMSSSLLAPPLAAHTAGLFNDPNYKPRLSITLPKRFRALDIGTHLVDSFR